MNRSAYALTQALATMMLTPAYAADKSTLPDAAIWLVEQQPIAKYSQPDA